MVVTGDARVQDDDGSLAVMRDWLLDNGVTIAAMESTSTYWKPPFYCLEEVMKVWLPAPALRMGPTYR